MCCLYNMRVISRVDTIIKPRRERGTSAQAKVGKRAASLSSRASMAATSPMSSSMSATSPLTSRAASMSADEPSHTGEIGAWKWEPLGRRSSSASADLRRSSKRGEASCVDQATCTWKWIDGQLCRVTPVLARKKVRVGPDREASADRGFIIRLRAPNKNVEETIQKNTKTPYEFLFFCDGRWMLLEGHGGHLGWFGGGVEGR